MHQIKFITLLIVFLQIFISLAFANASSKLENNLKLSKLIDLENPWGMDLIDSDNILITEKKGTLSIYNFLNKKIIEKIYFKDVFLKRQGGLLDVLYIKHNKKQFAYTCYQDLKTDLVIARHEIKNNKFFNKKIIFNSEHRSNNGVHFGCRMIDYKGSILISLGDRGDRNNSQNPKNYPGTILKLNYQGIPDVNVENWKKLQDDSVGLMDYFEEVIGPYPWKQYSIIQGGDGGMEYAMCTMITGQRPYPSLFGVTAHEMAHAWFQHLLATNEAKHPWMDEGFTEYITSLAEEAVVGKPSRYPHKSSYDRYYLLVNSGVEQAQTVHSDRYDYNFAYGASSYSKGSVFLSQLGYIIGKDNLDKTLKRYYEEFKFKHPTPNDFKRVAEKVSDMELEWYLNDWTRTDHKIDYGLDISSLQSDRVVTLKRKARMPMPLDVEVSFSDGTKDVYYIPTDLMHGNKKFNSNNVYYMQPWTWASPEYDFVVQGNKKVVKVEIDPSKRLADYNQMDNSIDIVE